MAVISITGLATNTALPRMAGIAIPAGLATGVWSGLEEIESFWGVDKRFEPSMPESRRDELFSGWKTAVARAIG